MLARQEPSLPTIPAHDSISRALQAFHADALGDAAYICLSSKLPLGTELLEAAGRAPMSFQAQMQRRDALERLGLAQALLAHARASWLTQLLASETDPDTLRAISEGCERAANTFGRLTRLLRDYRQPRNSNTTVIGQANLAGQQIVQTNFNQRMLPKENDDEQTRIEGRGPAVNQALPPNAPRAALPASHDPVDAAVDEKHGTKNCRRKASSRDERVSTRRAVGRCHRAAKAGPTDD